VGSFTEASREEANERWLMVTGGPGRYRLQVPLLEFDRRLTLNAGALVLLRLDGRPFAGGRRVRAGRAAHRARRGRRTRRAPAAGGERGWGGWGGRGGGRRGPARSARGPCGWRWRRGASRRRCRRSAGAA